jgi:hypothetical protein
MATPEFTMSDDYQNYMKGDTLAIDVIASDDASRVNAGNWKAGDSYLKAEFGMLEAESVSLDFALGRQQFFRDELDRSARVGPGLPFMDHDSIAGSRAVASQKRMLSNYVEDANQIPKAEQAFNLFVPMANVAARSLVKADTVGHEIGVTTTTDIGERLTSKEKSALRSAMVSEGLDSRDSVSLKARNLSVTRNELKAATRDMASVLNDEVITGLRGEMSKAAADKQAIQDKIDKVARVIGYVETGASLIAGGAGALKSATGVAAAAADTGVADTSLDAVETGMGHVESGAGIAASVATMGMQLYYADEFARLDARITRLKGEVSTWEGVNAANSIEAKQLRIKAANDAYKLAVDEYGAAIDGRRAEMARVGAAADKKVDRRGRDQDASQTVLWMTSILEATSFMDSALLAGNDAKTDIDATYSMLSSHRSPYSDPGGRWEKVEDIWENGSQLEPEGADFKGVQHMRVLTENWLKTGGEMKAELDNALGSGGDISSTMSDSGYSGDY